MISICVPCYNEQDTIKDVIKGAFGVYPHAEMILVDDCSTDRTPVILQKLRKRYKGLRILRNKRNSGHAYSVLKALRSAKGEYVIYMDSDNQIRLKKIHKKLEKYHLVSGYRVHRQDKLFRKVVSFILKMVILLRHGVYIPDANCPFKGIRRANLSLLLTGIPCNSITPSICLEILARKSGMKVLDIPVKHYPYIKERKGTLQSLNRKSLTMFLKAFKEVVTL